MAFVEKVVPFLASQCRAAIAAPCDPCGICLRVSREAAPVLLTDNTNGEELPRRRNMHVCEVFAA
eukprot:6546455-Prymnesium_polylepis.2